MNKSCVIGIFCIILILMIMAAKFTTRDSRSRLYDAGFNYLEIQKANINNTIHESMKNFETFLNSTSTSTSTENEKRNNISSLFQPGEATNQ